MIFVGTRTCMPVISANNVMDVNSIFIMACMLIKIKYERARVLVSLSSLLFMACRYAKDAKYPHDKRLVFTTLAMGCHTLSQILSGASLVEQES